MATTYTPFSVMTDFLANSLSDIYTVPSSTKGLIHSIVLHNTSESLTETISLAVKKSSTDYKFYKINLIPLDTVVVPLPSEGMVLEAASILRGGTTTASTVTAIISGSTRVVS